MKERNLPLMLNIMLFFGWMIGFGIFPLIIYFDSEKKDLWGLFKSLFFIALAYIVFSLIFKVYFYVKERLKQSEEVQDIRKSISIIFSKQIIKKTIVSIIVAIIIFYVVLEFCGSTEINKPFNKSYYEVVYEANLSKDSTFKNIERIDVWVKVSRTLLFKRKIQLDYIYYKNKDIEFDEDEPIYLIVGDFVPAEFYLDGNDYKWYIELSSKKVSNYKYAY